MASQEITVRGQELGTWLREFRVEAGLALADAATRIDLSAGQLSRVEHGRRRPRLELVTALLAIYGITGARRRSTVALAREESGDGWWHRDRPDFPERQRTLISLESRATSIVGFEGVLVPGLLQTGEYTRALMSESSLVAPDEVERRMVTRLHRHRVLRRDDAPALTAIIDELALRRVIGGVEVQRRQLEHLLELAQWPRIRIHVVANSGAHAGVNGSFSLLRQPEGPDVVFLENLTCSLFIEDAVEIATYETAVRELLTQALTQTQSSEVIASLATAMDAEADSTWSPPI
ncbi:helix-turn-helix transcriptional regulator [Saccharopolyspora gloriosae]|uniref:Transcriptional regulator with XRE-family HTH domain n=1 Tax=Saccharopolyspora gloriosae TaxID=455344 RepID=A0A840NH77_9PSEU|nr:helix-turn-helix transcriptional regulator [Saccharopolyspora gloriosae]MBB5069618.1 transcriptional regulator with XRE-family HTH domain [Saccharopolyspora gloriosae]